jgi:GGDEF domain-containing protein
MSEFNDELFYITRALSRRNEPGTLITVTMEGLSGNVPDKVFREMGNIILSSVRIGYDIVGRTGNTFFVILQGTDTERAQVVIDRIKNTLQSSENINGKSIAEHIQITTTPITHDFETNQKLLPAQETI